LTHTVYTEISKQAGNTLVKSGETACYLHKRVSQISFEKFDSIADNDKPRDAFTNKPIGQFLLMSVRFISRPY